MLNRLLRNVSSLAPAGAIIGMLAVAILHWSNRVDLFEDSYESTILIGVNPSDLHGTFCSFGSVPEYKPASSQYITSTEFDVFRSRHLGEMIIADINLTQRWDISHNAALETLSKIIYAEDVNGTNLKHITVIHKNPDDARDIAQAAANAYQTFRHHLAAKDRERAMEELDKTVREQHEKVEDRRTVLSKIVRIKKIIPLSGENTNEPQDIQDYIDAKRAFETELDLLQHLKLKQIAERISVDPPQESVRILSQPSTPKRTSPNAKMDILKGGVFGLIISLFLSSILEVRLCLLTKNQY